MTGTKYLSVKFKDLHVMNMSVIYMKSQCGSDNMESLYSGGTRIDDQHVPLRITHDLQDMGMAAYEYVRLQFVDEPARPWVISSRISADMGHKHIQPLALEETVQRVGEAQVVVIAIAGDTFERLERGDLLRQFKPAAEVPGMPYLVHGLKELLERLVEDPVSV